MFSVEAATIVILWSMAIMAACACLIFVFKLIGYAADAISGIVYSIRRARNKE